MRTLFIGGPGRSGTSFVADRLGAHAQIACFPGIELKLFTEKNGLLDLHHALVETYSPNRATVALQQFRRMMQALIDGQYGQPALSQVAPGAPLGAMLDRFCARLTVAGHPAPTGNAAFFAAARGLLDDLTQVARGLEVNTAPALFLEKTPHALLAMGFLNRLAPGALYLHVMRDPRSIAQSLRRMRWGPDTLDACCAWVRSYCAAWDVARTDALQAGLDVMCLSIEAIAAAPRDAAGSVLPQLGLAPLPDLFAGAAPATLNGWATQCPAAERQLLDDRLADCAAGFGYRVAEIGVLSSTAPEPEFA